MEGVKKIVYGLKKVNPSAVETESGKLIRRPGPPFPGDCRGCSLVDFICVELDYPCRGIYSECRKSNGDLDCEGCEKMDDCLDNRPCCWNCKYLFKCLEIAKEEGGEDFVRHTLNCDWEEFVEAVKMTLLKADAERDGDEEEAKAFDKIHRHVSLTLLPSMSTFSLLVHME